MDCNFQRLQKWLLVKKSSEGVDKFNSVRSELAQSMSGDFIQKVDSPKLKTSQSRDALS